MAFLFWVGGLVAVVRALRQPPVPSGGIPGRSGGQVFDQPGWASSQRSASMAAMQPEPAAVMAWR